MKKTIAVGLAVCLAALACATAFAHFQMLLPSSDVVSEPGAVALKMLFNHPMEGHLMNMVKPKKFRVSVAGGKVKDLLGTLKEKKVGKFTTWETSFKIEEPGDHVFYVEPAPYWEPAEDCSIIHYMKVVVNGLGLEEGWDAELKLPVEIVPLVRPYGLWTGNLFRGIVKKAGRPVPFAEIEVEYYNEPGKSAVKAPTDAHVTQVVKADQNGVFAYAMPKAGWWGFAALIEADYKIKDPKGEEKAVELGALMWINVVDMK